MRTLWPRSMKSWWFNRALCSLIHLSALRNLSLKPWDNQHMLTLKVIEGRWRSNRNLLTVACNCSRLVKRFRFYRNLLLFFEFRYYPYYSFFFPHQRLESQISETASHSATKLHSYIDPYLTTCSARFGVDPDYHSGSRAKSVFSDSPHYLQNLSSDLQLQYL